MTNDPAGQFHFDPATYMEMILAEVPAYVALQDALVRATADVPTSQILELGVGTGETSVRVLAAHRAAQLTGIDESPDMLEYARARLPEADLRVARFEDPLPEGVYDIVVSALAVHHLDGDGKADLFLRIADRLRPGGRFVVADLVVPGAGDTAECVTPIDDGAHDKPSRVDDQLRWLEAAGFRPRVTWTEGDFAVISADRP